MRIIYDRTIHKECEIPEKMERFLEEIKMICKKYNLSISHEDGHGCFLIEEYNDLIDQYNASTDKELKKTLNGRLNLSSAK